MKRTWTIIGVADVTRSFEWYQSLLGLAKSSPAHDHWGRLLTPMERFCSACTNGEHTSIPR